MIPQIIFPNAAYDCKNAPADHPALYKQDASSFNQPLDKWNVSKVKSMFGMFERAGSFNQPLNKWNVKSQIRNDRLDFFWSCDLAIS